MLDSGPGTRRRGRIVVSALLSSLVFCPVPAQTPYHSPVPGSGVQRLELPDASACVYSDRHDRWIVAAQNAIWSASWNGTAISDVARATVPGARDMEGMAQTARTGSAFVYVLDERTLAVHRIDLDDWAAHAPAWGDGFVFRGAKVWDLGDATDDREGLAFVPGPCTKGLPGGCEGGGRFWVGRQGSPWVDVYELARDDATSAWVTRYARPAACTAGRDNCGLEYDWDAGLVWWQNDNDADNICATDPEGRFVDGTVFPTRTGAASHMEGFCFDYGRDEGPAWYVLTQDDNGAGGRDGLYFFEDQFCGDGSASRVETCDGEDLKGATCADCGQGACGAGGTGTLACNATCDGFDTTGCVTAAGPRPGAVD